MEAAAALDEASSSAAKPATAPPGSAGKEEELLDRVKRLEGELEAAEAERIAYRSRVKELELQADAPKPLQQQQQNLASAPPGEPPPAPQPPSHTLPLAAAASGRRAPPALGGGPGSFFYKPVRSDPVDCLLAASLLRLSCSGSESGSSHSLATPAAAAAARFQRLSSGVYRFGGASGPRLLCRAEGGKLVLQLAAEAASSGEEGEKAEEPIAASAANADEAGPVAASKLAASGPPLELREFLESQLAAAACNAASAA